MRIAAAIALHVLLVWALWSALARADLLHPVREVWTSLVAISERPARPPPAVATSPAASARPRAPAVRAPLPIVPAPRREPQAITLPPAPDAATVVAAVPPASAPSAPVGSILDTDATRAAIRAIARGPLLSERVAAATGIAPAAGANERLAQGVDTAKHGDCLKGDYPLGGGGLLSLPFLAIAAATGKCAK